MFYQLKPAFAPIQEVPGAGVPWVEVLTRKEVEQRTNTTEIPFLERSLVHSHNCKAELLENCAAGTVLIPRKERHGSEVAFAFWLTGERLTFVDDSGQVANLLEQFSQQPGLDHINQSDHSYLYFCKSSVKLYTNAQYAVHFRLF